VEEYAVILPAERPYDLGPAGNFTQIIGGWSALLPWNAWRAGMRTEDVLQWPLAPRVREQLVRRARRLVAEAAGREGGLDRWSSARLRRVVEEVEEEAVVDLVEGAGGVSSPVSAPRRPGPDRIAYTRL
jgi:hypothetical protein